MMATFGFIKSFESVPTTRMRDQAHRQNPTLTEESVEINASLSEGVFSNSDCSKYGLGYCPFLGRYDYQNAWREPQAPMA